MRFRLNKATVIFSLIYDIMFCFGINYMLRQRCINAPFMIYIILFAVTGVISYIVLNFLASLLARVSDARSADSARPGWMTGRRGVLIRFLIVWIPLTVIFLNIYPGTLCVDAVGQLDQALGSDGYSNLSPFINTILIEMFVRLGILIRDVNLGVAMYTVFQYTFYSVAAVYALTVLDKAGITTWLLVVSNIFFILPINALYAVSMWKDTFFAVMMLLNMAYATDVLISENVNKRRKVTLSVLTVLTCLSRNSGVASMAVGAVCVAVYAWMGHSRGAAVHKDVKCVVVCELAGVAAALVILEVIYPLAGISSLATITGTAPEIQQISRVVADDVYTESEAELILSLGSTDDMLDGIKASYNPTLVDSARGYYNLETVKTGDFWRIWLRIGISHPKEYFLAFVDHNINYFWPLSSSWLVDCRIFDNLHGVTRSPLIFADIDLTETLKSCVETFLPLALFSNSGITLWAILLCMYLCIRRKNYIGCLLAVPYLMVYIGLLPVSYGSLFRYTYSAVLGMPLLAVYVTCNRRKEVNESN